MPRCSLLRVCPLRELADYLGILTSGFTLRTYTHLVPSSHERARRRSTACSDGQT